ncbi:hypothetical protein Ga0074812_10888 [Parafrankia irregularis]|uniref:Uncharacterized protein n=1 Tax=Parafrankia irregularis TaxID=795642 RepID=A0A0S4QLV3_9ACTN|nr:MULTISPECIES: hypothetical protein [Parafrankia]MBE3200242.1 hypothetical protein [Parafrankia sp. CH37]CUU56560.1 hypothetical protein Ga0074812_10888 [Parafrankia irregularis]
MTRPAERSCPPWCAQPAGHLVTEPAGPGDYHISAFTVIDLPQIPGLRDTTAIQVAIEQYVTATTTHQPMIAIGLGADDADNEALTLDEIDALISALTRAVAHVRATAPCHTQDDHGPV